MGFFEDLGRKVGKFTHEAKEAAADGVAYACTDCGAEFYTEQETCPECGSENVVERDLDAGDDGSGANESEPDANDSGPATDDGGPTADASGGESNPDSDENESDDDDPRA